MVLWKTVRLISFPLSLDVSLTLSLLELAPGNPDDCKDSTKGVPVAIEKCSNRF